jgi:hypothetical protein
MFVVPFSLERFCRICAGMMGRSGMPKPESVVWRAASLELVFPPLRIPCLGGARKGGVQRGETSAGGARVSAFLGSGSSLRLRLLKLCALRSCGATEGSAGSCARASLV